MSYIAAGPNRPPPLPRKIATEVGALVTARSLTPSLLKSLTMTGPGLTTDRLAPAANDPSPLLYRIVTALVPAFTTARSVRPSLLKSAVATELPPSADRAT